MKSFLAKVVVFCAALMPLYFVLHEVLYETHHWLRTKNDPTAVYVIGDSRTYNAVDLTALRERTGRQFYSYMQHAMSEYSFIKFAEMVPPGATVLYGPSWGLLMRDKDDASYRSGFSRRGLRMLAEGAGEWWHFRKIFIMNRIPVEAPFFKDTPYPLDELDEPRTGNFEQVKGFYMQPEPAFYGSKKAIAHQAIEILLSKGCRVEVIDIPIPEEMKAIRELHKGSVIRELGLIGRSNVRVFSDIPLVDPSGKNVWADADHMNQRGRRLMTEFFVTRVFGKSG